MLRVQPTPNGVEPEITDATVLISHYDGNILEMYRQIVEDVMGLAAVTVSRTEDALREGMARRFDLILITTGYDDLKGYEAARMLKDYWRGHGGITILGTCAGHENRQRFLDAGADDFFLIPINPNSIRSLVHELLRIDATRLRGYRQRA